MVLGSKEPSPVENAATPAPPSDTSQNQTPLTVDAQGVNMNGLNTPSTTTPNSPPLKSRHTRKTSIIAYNKIKASGILTKLKLAVFEYIWHNGPVTQNDLMRDMNRGGNTGALTTRFSELERMGAIEIMGESVDFHTKMKVNLWDVTGKIPVKDQRPEKAHPVTEFYAALKDKYLEKISYSWRLEMDEWVKEYVEAKTK